MLEIGARGGWTRLQVCGWWQGVAGFVSESWAGAGLRNPRKAHRQGGCHYCFRTANEASGVLKAEGRDRVNQAAAVSHQLRSWVFILPRR